MKNVFIDTAGPICNAKSEKKLGKKKKKKTASKCTEGGNNLAYLIHWEVDPFCFLNNEPVATRRWTPTFLLPWNGQSLLWCSRWSTKVLCLIRSWAYSRMSISVFEINNKNNLMIRTFYKNHGEYMFVITSNVILYYFRFWLQ